MTPTSGRFSIRAGDVHFNLDFVRHLGRAPDPAFNFACGRAPETRVDLMSQPTLSRLENTADAKAL